MVDYETHKITATTMSTTVAELHGLMRCYGSAIFLRGLWSDITSEIADVHIRTDANNLVTTASTTHQPEQKETLRLIQMLRKESNSGQTHDLAHVRSQDCLADSLTKHSAKADELIKAVLTGNLLNVDASRRKSNAEGDATSETGSEVTTTNTEAYVKDEASAKEHPG